MGIANKNNISFKF